MHHMHVDMKRMHFQHVACRFICPSRGSDKRPTMATTEEYLIAMADRLKQAESRMRALADDLETIGDELLAKVVEIDTARQRGE